MTGFDAIWPFFLCIALLLAFARLPVLNLADTPPHPSANRISTLDGLRGFLALCVFFHHAIIYHRFLLTDVWDRPDSHFYASLRPIGVDMFFLITGYLFWSIIIKQQGKQRWLDLYVGRLFRIGPLFLFAGMSAMITAFCFSGFILNVSIEQLFKELARIMGLGVLPFPALDGYKDSSTILAGVTWTLQYEWGFYLSLLITGQIARFRILQLMIPAVVLPFLLFHISDTKFGFHILHHSVMLHLGAKTWSCAALFCIGMICASLRSFLPSLKVPNLVSSGLVVLLMGLVSVSGAAIFSALPVILLGLSFLLIVFGCDLFGLLLTMPARRLGNASYGIYLLQGLVLAWMFAIAPVRAFALASAVQYWVVIFACALLLVLGASVAHHFIEQPGIRLGRRVTMLARDLARRVTINRGKGNSESMIGSADEMPR